MANSGSYDSSQKRKSCDRFRTRGLNVSKQMLKNFCLMMLEQKLCVATIPCRSAFPNMIRANNTHDSSQTMLPLSAISGLTCKNFSHLYSCRYLDIQPCVARVCIEPACGYRFLHVCYGRCLPTSQYLFIEKLQLSF